MDAHCHIYPERVAAKAVDMTGAFYESPAAGTGVVQNMLTLGACAGFDGYVVQSVASTPHHVSSINHFIAAEVAAAGGCLTGLGAMHPDTEDKAAVVSPIGELCYMGQKYTVGGGKIGEVTQKLYDELTGIQWGKKEDTFGWTEKI